MTFRKVPFPKLSVARGILLFGKVLARSSFCGWEMIFGTVPSSKLGQCMDRERNVHGTCTIRVRNVPDTYFPRPCNVSHVAPTFRGLARPRAVSHWQRRARARETARDRHALTVRSRCAHSALTVRSQCAHSALTVRSQCAHSPLTVSAL